MSKMILVATKPNEQIYWVADREGPDGVAVRNDAVVHLDSFWSYVGREADLITPLTGTAFLSEFWTRPSDDQSGEFAQIYVDRSQPIPKELSQTIQPFLIAVPRERSGIEERLDERLIDLSKLKKDGSKSLASHHDVKAAFGRRLRVGAGRKWSLPTEIVEFRSAIGDMGEPATREQVRAFLQTPEAKPIPKKLKYELNKWLLKSDK